MFMDLSACLSYIAGRGRPRILSSVGVFALEGFLSGFAAANASVRGHVALTTAQFHGPEQANACLRAYLETGDEELALERVIAAFFVVDGLSGAARAGDGHLVLNTGPDISVSCDFVDLVRLPIQNGHSAMVLGEPTVVRLGDFASGFVHGLSALIPESGKTAQQRLANFELGLQARFGYDAPWYGLIRAFWGNSDTGLRKFVELWDAYSSPPASR